MAHTKQIKKSEARILIYLAHTDLPYRYLQYMSTKLEIEYGYLSKIMKGLEMKKWIKRANSMITKKVFYNLTKLGEKQLKAAKDRLTR